MKVYWTDRAKWHLRSIEEEIAKDNPSAAKALTIRILKRSRQIGNFPNSGRRTPEYELDDIRELLERPYRIIYRIESKRIDVLAVMHYRQLLPNNAAEMEQKN